MIKKLFNLAICSFLYMNAFGQNPPSPHIVTGSKCFGDTTILYANYEVLPSTNPKTYLPYQQDKYNFEWKIILQNGTFIDPTFVGPSNNDTVSVALGSIVGAIKFMLVVKETANPTRLVGPISISFIISSIDSTTLPLCSDSATFDLNSRLIALTGTNTWFTNPACDINDVAQRVSNPINPSTLPLGLNKFYFPLTCNLNRPPLTASIYIIEAPNAGIGSTLVYDSSSTSTVNLFDLLTGNPDVGGVWNPSQVYTPNVDNSGFYTYTVSSSSIGKTCKTSSVIRITESTTGLFDGKEQNIKVYPIPSSKTLNIQLPDGAQQIVITSIQGAEVFVKSIQNENEIELNIEGFAPGIYNISIQGKELFTTKFIVQ